MEMLRELEFLVGLEEAPSPGRVLPLSQVHSPCAAWSLVPRPSLSRARRRRFAAAARRAALCGIMLALTACSRQSTPAVSSEARAMEVPVVGASWVSQTSVEGIPPQASHAAWPTIEEITFQSGEFKLVGDSVGPGPTLMRSTFPILGDDRSPIRPLRCLR
jgi:hypothetical protein